MKIVAENLNLREALGILQQEHSPRRRRARRAHWPAAESLRLGMHGALLEECMVWPCGAKVLFGRPVPIAESVAEPPTVSGWCGPGKTRRRASKESRLSRRSTAETIRDWLVEAEEE